MMNLRFYSEFYGTDQSKYRLEIYKEGYEGEAEEILLAEDPIKIHYEQDDIFKPTKLSGCTIKVLTPIILTDLYTGKVLDVRIDIYKDDEFIWTGFNSPNIYNSEWLTDYDATEINGIDTLSALLYVKYGNKYYWTVPKSTRFTFTIGDYTDSMAIGSYGASLIFKRKLTRRGYYYTYAYCGADYVTIYSDTLMTITIEGEEIEPNTKHTYTVKDFLTILEEAFNYVNQADLIVKFEYMNSLGNYEDWLGSLSVNDRTFFDEDENPLSYLEVVEHICQFLGVTITQWKNEYLILEVEKASQAGENSYISYTLSNNRYSECTKSINPIKASVADANAAISLGDVYNQINVLGNIIETDQDVINLDSSDNANLSLAGEILENDLFDGNLAEDPESRDANDLYDWHLYFNFKGERTDCTVSGTETDITSENLLTDSLSSGECFIERFASRKDTWSMTGLREADPQPIDFTNGIVFKIGNSHPTCGFVPSEKENIKAWLKNSGGGNVVFSMTAPNRMYALHDTLVLNFNLSFSSQLIKDMPLNEGDSSIVDKSIGLITGLKEEQYYNALLKGINAEGFTTPFILKCILKIGKYYYVDDGETTGQWTTDFGYMMVCGSLVREYDNFNGNHTVFNTVDFRMNLGDGTSGMLIPINSTNIFGELKFSILDAMARPFTQTELEAMTDKVDMQYLTSQIWRLKDDGYEPYEAALKYCHIDSINIKHYIKPSDSYDSIIDTAASNEDLLYSAEIDSSNVNEFDDINLYLCTYNPDLCNMLSYSYVMDYDSNYGYIDTLLKDGYKLRPEEHIVRMYVNHYKDPKIIYSNILKNDGYKPIDGVYVESLGKTLAIGSITYDLQFNTAEIKAYEL